MHPTITSSQQEFIFQSPQQQELLKIVPQICCATGKQGNGFPDQSGSQIAGYDEFLFSPANQDAGRQIMTSPQLYSQWRCWATDHDKL